MKRYIKSAEGLTSKQRAKIARESTDPKELKRLAYDNAKSVRLEVLKNKHTPDKENIMLSKEFMNDPDSRVRKYVADYSRDAATLSELSNDSHTFVRYYVAGNDNIDSDTLHKLANDSEYVVRSRIARNTDDVQILTEYAKDEDSRIRTEVAVNPNTPNYLLRELADDDDDDVRSAVAWRLHDDPTVLSKLVNDSSADVRIAIAKNTKDSKILAKLASDPDRVVRCELAESTNDKDILNMLASDDDDYVRSIVARRRKSPKTDWSIPLYSINNYTDIEDEINKVIDQAANLYSKQYHGTTAHITVPEGVYDDNGKITIDIGNESYEIDADDILAPATSKNKKADCVKTLVKWMEANLN